MKSVNPLLDLLAAAAGRTCSEPETPIGPEGVAGLVEPLSSMFVSRDEFAPIPTIDARDRWEGLSSPVIEGLLTAGEAAAGEAWPLLLAERYLDYSRDGNRSRYSKAYFGRRRNLAALVLAECCGDAGRFLDEIVNGIWLICEESSWCVPAHVHPQRAGVDLPDVDDPVVDLFAAETAALLSWTFYLMRERLCSVSPLVPRRIEREVLQRVVYPYLERDDWPWMGFATGRINNWNPWINSNVLASTLIVEHNPDTRARVALKGMRSVDRFLGPYPSDGGCDEGPGYWGRAGASLFDFLELLHFGTDGAVNGFELDITREIGRFVYRVHIAGDQYVNFADAPAVVHPPAALIVRFGRAVGDATLEGFGRRLLDRRADTAPNAGAQGSLGRVLPELFLTPRAETDGEAAGASSSHPDTAAKPVAPLPRDVWLPEIEVMVARDTEGSEAGWFLAAKGGHNDESHNHNDIGNFIVYRDGNPVIVDAGVETYTRKTFSPERYDIWTMQSAYHSLLPTVDGAMQRAGREFSASGVECEQLDTVSRLTLDIASAYSEDAGIASWCRTVELHRGEGVRVSDRYELSSAPDSLELAVLTPCRPSFESPGRIGLAGGPLPSNRRSGDAEIGFDADIFEARWEEIEIDDDRMHGNWGERLFRIVFGMKRIERTRTCAFSVRHRTS